jgi:hypothetical protein
MTPKDKKVLKPKAFIEEWFFKKGHTPGDAHTIAGQLTLNELELYTHTKRFIFELIQNADDMPAGNRKVKIDIVLLKNHLLFMHNGKAFDREDVMAIADAAKSTKAKGLTQTGYKGIGFKSVFTDSVRVYIKSADYSFKFDKKAEIYKNFEAVYAGYINSLTEEAKEKFRDEYSSREAEFTNTDKIPWQIKPIWVDRYPEELQQSKFKEKYNVAIALEISAEVIKQKDYAGMIKGLLGEPRFLLFLRNTNGFCFVDGNEETLIEIAPEKKKSIIDIVKNDTEHASYIKHDFSIEISNEGFEQAGMNMYKKTVDGKVEFYDGQNIKLENIPEKLGHLDKTVISFSARIKFDKKDENAEHGQIVKLSKDESILFNYLPTSDQRFEFPFLVNADFVSKTDREFIQIENKWNHYLFYQIGKSCLQWAKELGEIIEGSGKNKQSKYLSNYLNILPDRLLDDDNGELASINQAYNKGFKKGIETVAFVADNDLIMRKCDELIIDDTDISLILGTDIFNLLSKTAKHLPNKAIEKSKLKKNHFGIVEFATSDLVTALNDEENKKAVIDRILSLDQEQYSAFLVWLNNFYQNKHNDIAWIKGFSFVRHEGELLNITEALKKNNLIIRTAKTEKIEALLQKAGFTLSEFKLDDEELTAVYNSAKTENYYLTSDSVLFQRIKDSGNFTQLDPTEKNQLLLFFEGLKISDSTKSLSLFNNRKNTAVLRPLSTLISNDCTDIPDWLEDAVISAEEEGALSDQFKKMLIRDKNFLKDVFCNKDTYEIISKNIDQNNVTEFYEYILALHTKLPENEKKLNYNDIPWLYIPAKQQFAKATEVYFEESLTRIQSSNKYNNIAQVITNFSKIDLADFSALPLKEAFGLGTNNKSSERNYEAKYDRDNVNDFLDFLELKGSEFFKKVKIEKLDDSFIFGDTGSLIQFYTEDEKLLERINKDVKISGMLLLLPKELYSTDRHKIGLLEGNALLDFLIENGMRDAAFSEHLLQIKDKKLREKFIEHFEELDLESGKTYDRNSNEYRIIEIFCDYAQEDKANYEKLQPKIKYDGLSVSERGISDDISIIYDIENEHFKTELNLSDVLSNYRDRSSSLREIFDSFPDLSNEKLEKVFKKQKKGLSAIYNELQASNLEYLNAYQSFFVFVYKEFQKAKGLLTENPEQTELALEKEKPFFTDLFHSDPLQYSYEAEKFITFCFEHKYPSFIDLIAFPDLNPETKVIDDTYALEAIEIIPIWLIDFINAGQQTEKINFLIQAGLNGTESNVVLIRKGFSENNSELFSKGLALVDNVTLLTNTLEWLKSKSESSDFVLSADYLSPIYKKLEAKEVKTDFLIPVLTDYDTNKYQLVESSGNIFHLKNESWKVYGKNVFDYIRSKDEYVTDLVLPESYHESLGIVNEQLIVSPDTEKLEDNSCYFESDFYYEWNLKEQYPIKIYTGEKIPYNVYYQDELLLEATEGKSVNASDVYYIVESEVGYIPYPIRELLPEDIFNKLVVLKEDYSKNAHKISFEVTEIQGFQNLFKHSIPEEYYKDINLAACVSALVELANEYDVKQVNLSNSADYAQIDPVIDNISGVSYTVMCRSAKNGLLYLTAQSWDRLDRPDVKLFVKTGSKSSDYWLFNTKDELMQVSDTEYQVFRVEAPSSANNIDDIINGKFAKDKVWLILKMKENEVYNSIFERISLFEQNPDYDNFG